MVTRHLVEYARMIGHTVNITSIRPRNDNWSDVYDIVILCDVFNEPTRFESFEQVFLEKIVNEKKFVHFDNSYVDSCDLGYLPCNGRNTTICPHKSYFHLKSNLQRKSFSLKCFQGKGIVQKLYRFSLANIFVSPLHHSVVSKMLNLDMHPFFILRPLIDTDKFYNMNLERDIEYLFAGAISEAKGMENLVKMFQNSDKRLTMIGHNIYGHKFDFVDYTGFVPYEEMPTYFNRAKHFVYLPRWPEPQGRVVVEAALCGCDLITNENAGAASFGFDISDAGSLQKPEKEFFDYIGKLAEGKMV